MVIFSDRNLTNNWTEKGGKPMSEEAECKIVGSWKDWAIAGIVSTLIVLVVWAGLLFID